MRGVNNVILLGRLGRDPEVRVSAGGQPWGTFSLATGRGKKGDDGQWTEETDWHAIKVFGKDADFAHRMLRRGSLVHVSGTIVYEKWTSADGTPKTATRIHADRVVLAADGQARPRDPVTEVAVDAGIEEPVTEIAAAEAK
jgi:single-strand DNA-binding protein